jgi:hypothetical protein
MRSATRRIRSASATDDPPYFCTTSATFSCLSGPEHPNFGYKSTTEYVPPHGGLRRDTSRPACGIAAVSAQFSPQR